MKNEEKESLKMNAEATKLQLSSNRSINWLLGGPYYEVSFLLLNQCDNEIGLISLIDKFGSLNYKIEIYDGNSLENQIKSFFDKAVAKIELNVFINICGKQRSKIYIERLSDEILEIDFCFLEENVNKNKMKKLKYLLNDLMKLYDGIVGVIAVETDCSMIFFETKEPYPHKDYSLKKIKHFTNEEIKNMSGIEEIIWK
ncbi:MAG: hypothetical protein LBU73_09000 [Helicobacteraceae bacterium]|jgi:hypothetical protein|nr:hypothetical protein [Helicobacteraceae bacterium]